MKTGKSAKAALGKEEREAVVSHASGLLGLCQVKRSDGGPQGTRPTLI